MSPSQTDSSAKSISGPEQLGEAAEFGPWHLQISSGPVSKSSISLGLPISSYLLEKAGHGEKGENQLLLQILAHVRSWNNRRKSF